MKVLAVESYLVVDIHVVGLNRKQDKYVTLMYLVLAIQILVVFVVVWQVYNPKQCTRTEWGGRSRGGTYMHQ